MPSPNAGYGGEEGVMAADNITVKVLPRGQGVIECEMIPMPDRPPILWPLASDTSLSSTSPHPSAVQARAQDASFVAQCSLSGLRDRLPLSWPASPGTPPSPKNAYRSHYVYLGWEDLRDSNAWEYLSDFDVILRLVDFGPLRPVLAQLLGWTSARGWMPFDPVSIFLLLGWQITNGWSRAELLRNIRNPRYADYVQTFGFENDIFPTEGGLRYWLTAIGQNSTSDETVLVGEEQQIEIAIQHLNQLIAQSVRIIVDAGFLSSEAWQQAFICPDGMIHDAASRRRCSSVQDSCYQPITPGSLRPCPAKDKDRKGCDCATQSCALVCRHATPRDPQARFIWYAGSNQPTENPNQLTDPDQAKKTRGEGRYGYRSVPIQLADPFYRFSIVLLDDFLPANQREENPVAALLCQLSSFYPDLRVDAAAGDAGFGYDVILSTVYNHLHARRVIDLRAHSTDKDKSLWPVRGYDDKGRSICPFGYAFTANGFDFARQRHKWFCAHACRNGAQPAVSLENVTYPPHECAYLDLPHGRVLNVGERFEDGSIRLVRDIPVGTPAWKRIYHRARNAVEGRNAAFEHWNLKRLPVYGDPRGKATIFLADVWLNLSTLARLVREATAATGCT